MIKYFVFAIVILLSACSGKEKTKEISNNVNNPADKSTSQNENSLVKKAVLQGKMNILLPSQFGLMPKDILETKYPAPAGANLQLVPR